MEKRTRSTILSLAVALVAMGGAANAREIVGRGDLTFYLDRAAFMGRDGRVIEEISIRIPNNELKFTEAKDGYQSRVELTVLIEDAEGNPVIQDAKEMTFSESDADRTDTSIFFQTVIKRYHLAPGAYDLSYAVEDLEAPKVSLMGMMNKENRKGVVRGVRLNLPEFIPGEPAFSDPKYLWDVEYHAGETVYHPNPSRLYGLYKDSLMVYMELYLPDDMAPASTFEFHSEIVDDSSQVVAGRDIDLPNPGATYGEGGLRAYPVLIRENLSRIVAGTYTLYVSFGLDGRLLRRVRCGTFSVAWDIRTWEVPRREFLAEARFLLSDDEFEEFRYMDLGDQEKMLDRIWKTHDPDPETAENSAYELFLVRLAYVNEHYAEGGHGVFSPRGQIYMRFGPPDEMVQDVIPINRETVREAIETVEDRYHTFNSSSHSVKPGLSGVSTSTISDPRDLAGVREGDHQAYPFELWVYHTEGAPILERDRTKEIDMGMRYLFVDRQGYGRYKLESSSSITNK